jgi:hypothetical protein
MVNDMPDFAALVARIDTGTDNAETSRALVVFNTTEETVSGVAVFEASMTWPVNDLVPFVAVTDTDGNAVASDIPDLAEGPDPNGREDHRLLAFQLRFAVSNVSAKGWRTYLAYLAGDAGPDEVMPPDPEGLEGETPGLQVIETTRHGGDLPPTGTF